MRILLHLRADCPLELPLSYQELLIGFIYSNISDEKYRQFLHDQGYSYQNKRFKHFAFSRIQGNFRTNKTRKSITFYSPFSLLVTSPIDRFLHEFAQSMLFSNGLQLGRYRIYLESFETLPEPDTFPDTIGIRMLSPIVTYSTLNHPNGVKYTYYYSPYQDQFSSMIETNLKRRFFSMHSEDSDLANSYFSIAPLRVEEKHKVVTRFRGIIIEGWMGDYEVTGDPRLLKWAFHSNLGNKGSQGFGVFEII